MFDPAQPATKSALSSAVMRSQLTSLKALIDALTTLTTAQVDATSTLNPGEPATASAAVMGDTLHLSFGIPSGYTGAQGSDGGPGPQGPPFAQAVVDGVTTLLPGETAWVGVSFDGSNVHFSYGIPRGEVGVAGTPGDQGPPFAQAVIDGVTTLPAGAPASVSVSFDGSNVHFTFDIPQGADGTPGTPGQNGSDGQPGAQGQPGEVTNAQLTASIATTALNPTAVSPLSQAADAAYNQAQMQQVMDKLDEVLAALKRP